MPPLRTCLLAFSLVVSAPAFAQTADDTAGDKADPVRILDALTVTGAAGTTGDIAGSVSYLDGEEFARQGHVDVLRILRNVPGVNIQEEEGYGLRPNIGLRGSGSDRNSRIAVLEDGVPIAPAAYASPSAYYFPSAGRISAIEVTKGPATIQYGPRTTGGAVHLFSTPLPEEASGKASLLFGDFGRQSAHLWAGTRVDLGSRGLQGGVLLETFQDEADGFLKHDSGGDTGFDVSDYVFKAGLYNEQANMPWSAELKYQTRKEISNQTYLGLTDADFKANAFRLYDAAKNDQMNNENELIQFSGTLELFPDVSLTMTAYSNEFARNWYKVQGVNAAGNGASADVSISSILRDPVTYAAEYDLLRGAASLDDSIVLRANNRKYYSRGIQGVLLADLDLAGLQHMLKLGARSHNDQEDRFQKEDAYRLLGGELQLTTGGAAGSQSNRVSSGEALSLYALDQVQVTDALQITAGARFEDYELTRKDFATTDPRRAAGPVRTRTNANDILLPSLSALYDISDSLSLFAGVHKGFAIASPGNTTSDPEESWDYEAGARYGKDALSLEAVAYFNAYSNLLGDCTASSGGGCIIGDQFDGGEVDVKGLEVTARWDAGEMFGTDSLSVPFSLAYTYTDASFQSAFDSDYEPWGNVQAGDELPYVAEHQITLGAGAGTKQWAINALASYVGETRARAGQGAIAANELIDARWVVDLAASYEVADNIRLKLKAENLLDETYIAARRPAGLRPGKPREIMFGVEVVF